MQDTERVQLQVLLTNLMRSVHYLQISDQALATGSVIESGVESEAAQPNPVLGRVGIAAGMLDRSSQDFLEQVTGVIAERPTQ